MFFDSIKRIPKDAIDPSGLNDAKKCLRLYFFRHRLGYRAKDQGSYLLWGSCIHKFFDVAEKSYKENNNIHLSIGLATIAAMNLWGNTKDPPPDSKWGFQTKARLSDMLIFIADWWRKEKESKIFEVIQTEMVFNVEVIPGFFRNGKADQLVKWHGAYWGRDFKTTSKEFKWYQRSLYPSDQFATYTVAEGKLANQKLRGQVVEVFFLSKDKGPTHHQKLVTYNPELISDWENDQKFWKNAIAFCEENDIWPKSEPHCPFCQFYKVCAEGPTMTAQEYILKSQYVYDPWSPEHED